MMKKTLFISTVLAVTLMAGSIEFNEAPKATRVMPEAGKILSFNQAIEHASQCVVNISAKKRVRQNIPQAFMDPFFREFFNMPFGQIMPRERVQRSLGSGVIVSSDGYIVTNNHVIDGADEVHVTLPNSTKEYKAKIVGTDPKTDIAVIKIDAKDLPAIQMGDSDALKTGDLVFAMLERVSAKGLFRHSEKIVLELTSMKTLFRPMRRLTLVTVVGRWSIVEVS